MGRGRVCVGGLVLPDEETSKLECVRKENGFFLGLGVSPLNRLS